MSFIDQDMSRERALSGAITIALVGCVGYALASGLAMSVVHTIPWEIPTASYRSPPPPPPPRPEPVLKQSKPQPSDQKIIVPLPPLHLPPIDPLSVATSGDNEPTISTATVGVGSVAPPTRQIDLSARARPVGRPGDWVTTDDYPPSALRAGAEGRTSFRLDLGLDGRATGCTVTASSGSDELDRTTCRLLERRAHFAPALDADGHPFASSYAGSVVWRAPAD